MANLNSSRSLFAKLRASIIAVALVVFMMSCLDDDNADTVQPVPVSYVSIYNASPDAPALDVIVDSKRVNAYPFDYTDYSGYLNFYTGERNFTISSFNASNALVDTTLNLVQGNAYSLFLIDRVSSLETLLVRDSTAAPATGKAVVRFVHLSPDAPQVSVNVAGDSTELFTQTGFRSVTSFKEVDAKTYSFEVKDANGNVLLNAKDVNLESGGYYSILVRGFATPPAGSNNALSVEVI